MPSMKPCAGPVLSDETGWPSGAAHVRPCTVVYLPCRHPSCDKITMPGDPLPHCRMYLLWQFVYTRFRRMVHRARRDPGSELPPPRFPAPPLGVSGPARPRIPGRRLRRSRGSVAPCIGPIGGATTDGRHNRWRHSLVSAHGVKAPALVGAAKLPDDGDSPSAIRRWYGGTWCAQPDRNDCAG